MPTTITTSPCWKFHSKAAADNAIKLVETPLNCPTMMNELDITIGISHFGNESWNKYQEEIAEKKGGMQARKLSDVFEKAMNSFA